jgi:hypothetical protein
MSSPQASPAEQLRKWQIAAFALLFGSMAVSALQANAQAEPQTFLGSVQGHISCSDGGIPATNAAVTLVSVASMEGQKVSVGSLNSSTDFKGDYVFRGVPPGDYVLLIRHAGYVDDLGNVWQNFSHYKPEKQKKLLEDIPIITVANGSTHFDMVIRRGGAISGRVTFDNGAPVARASVLVSQVLKDLTRSDAQTDAAEMWNLRTTTDDRGRFRIAGLPKGDYRIGVSAHRVNSNTAGSFIVFAPNTFKENEAKLIAIDEGDELDDADITVPLNSLHSIGGAITRGGAPFPRVQLTIQRQGENGTRDTEVNSDGTYRVDLLLPGTYVIQAKYTLPGGVAATRSIIVTMSDSDVLDANLEMLSGPATR